VEYRRGDAFVPSRQQRPAAEPATPAGAEINTLRAIDILLGQLEQINRELATVQERAQAAAAENRAPVTQPAAEASAGIAASPPLPPTEPVEAADSETRFNALLEQYARFRADVEHSIAANPYSNPGRYAGMLFGIAA